MSNTSDHPEISESPKSIRCVTHLVEDSPAERDLFALDGAKGPHGRVASAIVELICSDESGGKMIGLEGGWGSGKTTVVNLVAAELKTKADIAMFRFDAWAHEGDPLRRTFLESLIRSFRDQQWIDSKRADDTINTLANRRKVTDTTTVPRATWLGTLTAISALLVPPGAVLTNKLWDNSATLNVHSPIDWQLILSVTLMVAPFLVLLANLIRIAINKVFRHKDAEPDDWAFLIGNAITRQVQESTETPQPTSIEFEDHFRRLMSEALPPDSNRRAVLVVDNLDRVDTDDALAVWSTLQTFLQYPGQRVDPWSKKTCVIVPYDPVGLGLVWRGNPSGEPNVASQKASESFLDKSFQIRFEVPPLLLSDWKGYLLSLLAQALPNHNEPDLQMVYRVISLRPFKNEEATPPTPREIKLFVNQIGVVHRQWQDEFPLAHVSYYVCLRRAIKDVRAALLPGGNLPKLSSIESMLENGSDVLGSLAGLSFNVRAQTGRQLLLTAPITKALQTAKPVDLKALADLHRDGFWPVLEDVIRAIVEGTTRNLEGSMTLARMSLCLRESSLLDDMRSEVSMIKHRVGAVAGEIARWAVGDDLLCEGAIAACHIASTLVVSRRVFQALSEAAVTPASPSAPLNWPENVTRLEKMFKEITGLGHLTALGAKFTLPLNASEWIDLFPFLFDLEPEWRLFLMPSVDFEQIRQALASRASGGGWSEKELRAMQDTQERFPNREWTELSQGIKSRLATASGPYISEVDPLLHALAVMRRGGSSNANDVLRELAVAGYLLHWLQVADNGGNVACRTWCLAMFADQQPGLAQTNAVGQSATGYSRLRALIGQDDLAVASHMLDIFQIAGARESLIPIIDNGAHALFVRCLRITIDHDSYEDILTPSIIVPRWQMLQRILDEDENESRFEKVFSRQAAGITQEIVNQDDMDDEKLSLYLLMCTRFPNDSFCQWCRRNLAKLDPKAWGAELRSFGPRLQLALALKRTLPQFEIGRPLQDALVEYGHSAATGELNPHSEIVARKTDVVGILDETSKVLLPGRLLREAIPDDGDCSDPLFAVFGEEMSSPRAVCGEKNIVAKLFSRLIDHRRTPGLLWLDDLLTKNPTLLNGDFDSDSVADFRGRLAG